MLVSVKLKDMNSLLIKMSPSSATSSMAPPPATLPGIPKHEPEIKEEIYKSKSHVGPYIDSQLINILFLRGPSFSIGELYWLFFLLGKAHKIVVEKNSQLRKETLTDAEEKEFTPRVKSNISIKHY